MPPLKINGNALQVERGGQGEAVVLVHGSWTGAGVWRFVASILRERFDVVAYDRLGHNGSDRPVMKYTRRRHEDDLIALIEELGAPAHVVASSYGGAMALSAAARRPDVIRSVAAHEPALAGLVVDSGTIEAAKQAIACSADRVEKGDVYGGTRAFFEQVALGPGGWDMVPEAFRTMALHNAGTFAAEMHDRDWLNIDKQKLAECPGRILLTQGDSSPAWFAETTEAVARVVPHAERALLQGAGHSPHSTHPEEYAALLTGWLREDVPLAGRLAA